MKKYRLKIYLLLLFLIGLLIQTPIYAKELDEYNQTTGIIYIGDSRTVGMDQAVDLSKKEDTYVVAKVGQGFRWYLDDARFDVKEIRKEHPHDNWIYIFNLGVNDLKNAKKYKLLVDALELEATVYTVSVNPVIDSRGTVSNKRIETFNNTISSVADNYIDTYSYLKDNGFSAPDGLHYDDETYKTIYSYINNYIEEQ